MPAAILSPVAALGQPLFGSVWLALLLVLGLVAVLLAFVAGVGRWLAATHPEPVAAVVAKQEPVAEKISGEVSEEILVVIAAAVQEALGSNVRISSVKPVQVSVEALMQHWSLEGRRQIYSSHRVR